MQVLKEDVRKELLRCAGEEFRKNGYRAASLRRISVAAGMTVGNIYRYYNSKDELFRAVLTPIVGSIEMMRQGLIQHESTAKDSEKEAQEHRKFVENIFYFIERYRDDLKLLIEGAGGSSMENYQENLMEWYGNLMLTQFKREWQQMGAQKAKISPTTIRLIARSVADSIKECIRKEYTLEEIMEIAKEMQDFFSGGTKTLIENKAKVFNLI